MTDDNANPPIVDISNLRLMPDWVANFGQAPSKEPRQYEEDRRGGGRGEFDRRGGGRDQRGRGAGGAGAPRPRGPERDGERRSFGGDRRRDDSKGGRFRPGGLRQGVLPERVEMPSGVSVLIEPDERSLEALASYVRLQGRAFSLFEAARLVASDAARHQVRFECSAERLVGLFSVLGGAGLFESKEEALRFALRHAETLNKFYQVEEIELEGPKGQFNSVAVCGISGEILGPPSHHSFQVALKRLHTTRFAHLPLEEYRRKIENKTDEELVEKWKAEQSKGTKWTWLKGTEGAEPVAFQKESEMEAHFRQTHGNDVVRELRTAIMTGTVRREQLSAGLGRLFRRNLEDSRKHLFELSQRIAQQLERRGLKLFKRRSGKLFVSRIKPRAIDPGVVFSPRVSAIVERVRGEPGILASKLLAEFATEAPEATKSDDTTANAAERALTEGQRAVILDLRWLADEGYIIEYSDGPVFLGIQGDPPNAKPQSSNAPTVAETAVAAAMEAEPEVIAETVDEPLTEVESQAEGVGAESEAVEKSTEDEPMTSEA
jgi:hypothetical protein